MNRFTYEWGNRKSLFYCSAPTKTEVKATSSRDVKMIVHYRPLLLKFTFFCDEPGQ